MSVIVQLRTENYGSGLLGMPLILEP